MTTMLYYMREHFINEVGVNVSLDLNLKDYDEYEDSAWKLLELLNDNPLKIKDGLVSIKDNFSTSNRSELTKILIDGVQNSMNRIFTPDFIRVVVNYNSDSQLPKLRFDCDIHNDEIVEGVPNVWEEYREKRGGKKVITAYLMGISINFVATFSIPDSDVVYIYKESGDPGSHIDNVRDITDAYLQMSAFCFAQFSNKMSRNLGLQEVYFQGE